MSKINDLSSKRTKLIADCQVLVNEGKAASQEYRTMIAEIDLIQSDIETLQKIERMLPSASNVPAPIATPAPVPVAAPAVVITRQDESKREHRAKLNAAWRSHLRGEYDPNLIEHRDILTTTASDGAAVVPQEFNGFVATAMKYYAPLTQFMRTRFSSNGRTVKVSKVDDTANGMTLIVEGSGTSVPEADPTFSSVLVSTDLFSAGQIRFSNELLEDSAFDLETFLAGLADVRYGRGLEGILTGGVDSSGTATPNNPGLLSVATVGTTTATLAAGVGFRDLVNLYESIDTAFLPRSVWLMSSQTRNTLLAAEDSVGRPFFVPSPNVDGFDMLLNRPIVINQSLPQLGVANATPILFGSLYDGFQMVASELRLTILRERYASTNESAIIPSTRVGSTGLVAGAIKSLKLAAS